jgi:hypothetical protein
MKRVSMPVAAANAMVVAGGRLTALSAWSQNDSYLIYGNRDGSVMPVIIGQTIDIPAWGATYDTVTYVHMPLASNDSAISARLGGYFPDYPRWDDESFLWPNDMGDGWARQSVPDSMCICGPPNPQFTFWTNGDTLAMCTFKMVVTSDPSCVGDTINPFREGYDPLNGGPLWGLLGGLEYIVPFATYPRLLILPSSNCSYVVGDINGDDALNGLDAVYGVNYFKGGPPPPYNCQCSFGDAWFVAGDVNGSCTFNGFDITYMVAYLKGGPAPYPCPGCPPGQ